jgi:large subunit ribosomal protein L19
MLPQKNIPRFKSGDTVKVHVVVKEGDKERIQIFEGVVIAKHSNGTHGTFTVRKMSSGIGVERVFPYESPAVSSVDVVKIGKVRRAKLYYLRNLKGKASRIEEVK